MKLAEPFTFFVDRSLGGAFVADALREAGHAVVVHDDEFEPDARDVEWLRAVGERGWVISALPRMTKVLRRWDVPIVATVTAAGEVSVLYANGVRLQPSRLVK